MLDIPVQASFAAIFEKTLPAASIEKIRKSHEWAGLYFQFSQLSLSDLDASDARKILDLWQTKENDLPDPNLLAISDQIYSQLKQNKILTELKPFKAIPALIQHFGLPEDSFFRADGQAEIFDGFYLGLNFEKGFDLKGSLDDPNWIFINRFLLNQFESYETVATMFNQPGIVQDKWFARWLVMAAIEEAADWARQQPEELKAVDQTKSFQLAEQIKNRLWRERQAINKQWINYFHSSMINSSAAEFNFQDFTKNTIETRLAVKAPVSDAFKILFATAIFAIIV
jgi:hypothetical protein